MSPKPPAIVAEELNAHMEAYKAGITPRRTHVAAPDEVRVAVEMARAAERHRNTPKSQRLKQDPSPRRQRPAPLVLPGKDLQPSSTQPPVNYPPSYNSYSVGNTLPTGVSWRYVDILQNDFNDKK